MRLVSDPMPVATPEASTADTTPERPEPEWPAPGPPRPPRPPDWRYIFRPLWAGLVIGLLLATPLWVLESVYNPPHSCVPVMVETNSGIPRHDRVYAGAAPGFVVLFGAVGGFLVS